jgi:hypothetical protein
MATQQTPAGLPASFDPTRGIEVLELTNIGRFKSYRLELPPGQVVEIQGGNGQGKTTLLHAIEAALESLRATEIDRMITLGEEGGRICLQGFGLTIEKVFRNGELVAIDISDANGTIANNRFGKPQAILDLAFKGTFLNPFDLLAAKDSDRVKAIAKTIKLDLARVRELLSDVVEQERIPPLHSVEDVFPAIERITKTLEEERREAGRELERQEKRTQALYQLVPKDWTPEAPKPVLPQPLGDVHDAKRAMEVRNAERRQYAEMAAALDADVKRYANLRDGAAIRAQQAQEQLQQLGADIEDEAALEQQIRELQQRLAAMQQRNLERQRITNARDAETAESQRLNERVSELTAHLKEKQDRLWELGEAPEDTTRLQAQIDAYEQRMAEYTEGVDAWGESNRRHEEARRSAEEETPLRTAHQVLDDQVKQMRQVPEKMLAGVEVPVDGMQIVGDQVYLRNPDTGNYHPLEAYGEAEQLLFCIRVAMALAPAPFILVDGIERCDPSSSRRLYQYITEKGFQAVCTRVTDGPIREVPIASIPADSWDSSMPSPDEGADDVTPGRLF